jgi:glycerate-2-kinase
MRVGDFDELLSHSTKFFILSAAFDGIEGNSPAMGAVVTNESLTRLKNFLQQQQQQQQQNHRHHHQFENDKMGMYLEEALNTNNSFSVFQTLGDALVVGQTGTNVNDMTIILLQHRIYSRS